ncbi:hypothetical protein H4219_000626 [Mycoemilia scoparia]|uniref:ATP-binding cassette sub-family D member 4 n=1 Tax=Mycoemilia scoparia TaxID=417184 RepID=A0A9W8A6Q9_9FUNG|nr:hypothetical protein H4219_000626 [Mycoemilia scoparia]
MDRADSPSAGPSNSSQHGNSRTLEEDNSITTPATTTSLLGKPRPGYPPSTSTQQPQGSSRRPSNESNSTEISLKSKIAHKDYDVNIKTLKALLNILKTVWSESRTCSIVSTTNVATLGSGFVLLRIVHELFVYLSGIIPSQYYLVLGNRDQSGFNYLLIKSLLVVLSTGISKALVEYVGGLLRIQIRSILTANTDGRYMKSGILYPLNLAKSIDNPDQRISQDIDRLSESLMKLCIELFLSPFLIIYYTVKCWSVSGVLGPALIYLYFISGAIGSKLLMPPIVRLVWKQEKEEGNFRYKQTRVINFSESIAFYGGEKREEAEVNSSLSTLIGVQRRLAAKKLRLNTLSQTMSYLGSILSYAIIAIPIFFGAYKDKPSSDLSSIISMNTFVSMYLIYLFTSMLSQAQELTNLVGYTVRLEQLWKELDRLNEKHTQGSSLESVISYSANRDQIKVTDLSVFTPQGKRLLSGISFTVNVGDNMIITGPNGCGKTSLLRTMCGLWASSTGHIAIPAPIGSDSKPTIMFLSQMPYMISGTLIEQVTYPVVHDKSLSLSHNIMAQVTEILHLTGLGKLAQDPLISGGSSIDASMWEKLLSPGEMQRIAIARVLFWKPRFAIMDEATSSVDIPAERDLYSLLINSGVSLISVGHRDSLLAYHNLHLRIDPSLGSASLDYS